MLEARERLHGDEPDLRLARLSADGDQVAFDVLINRYRADLVEFCRQRHSDLFDREELFQTTLIKAWRGIGDFDGRSTIRTWLYRIVVNSSVDEYRRRGRTDTATAAWATLNAISTESHERVVLDAMELGWALALLPPRYRVVSVLADRLGYPHAEIARMCGIPEATVRSRVWRARRVLRRILTIGPEGAVAMP